MEIPENHLDNLDEEREKLKQRYLQDFISFREVYLDDLPAERLLLHNPNYYLYKCRMNFFIGVAARISRLIEHGIITDEIIIKKGQEFLKYVRKGHPNPELSKQEDIDKVNGILDVMITALS